MLKKITVFFVMVSACSTSIINVQACQALRVAGANNWLPVAYINKKTGEPEGIAYDFAKIVGKELNIPVELDATLPWKRVLYYLEQGKIDMVASLYWTKERDIKYQYSKP